jgi:hypothetical protein
MSLFRRSEQRALPTSIDPYQITARPFSKLHRRDRHRINCVRSQCSFAAVTILG